MMPLKRSALGWLIVVVPRWCDHCRDEKGQLWDLLYVDRFGRYKGGHAGFHSEAEAKAERKRMLKWHDKLAKKDAEASAKRRAALARAKARRST